MSFSVTCDRGEQCPSLSRVTEANNVLLCHVWGNGLLIGNKDSFLLKFTQHDIKTYIN